MTALNLDRDGAALLNGAALSLLGDLDPLAARHGRTGPGARLHGDIALSRLLADNTVLRDIAVGRRGPRVKPVRAILFDKSPDANWSLGWHQDRTIAVAVRHEVPGFGPWTIKQGLPHVAPPFGLLEKMLTMRVHIDPVPAENAPLLIAPGSHRLGLISEHAIEAVVRSCEIRTCLAERGDVWLYSTPILHASKRASCAGNRRVLQIDFSADPLPPPLKWLGV
ncbi:phytanoyl-CoA dioxygenase [Sphingomonas koreensis]|nr:phytanoyl-CoA dioxygenase [Sphingomonas koreensis]